MLRLEEAKKLVNCTDAAIDYAVIGFSNRQPLGEFTQNSPCFFSISRWNESEIIPHTSMPNQTICGEQYIASNERVLQS